MYLIAIIAGIYTVYSGISIMFITDEAALTEQVISVITSRVHPILGFIALYTQSESFGELIWTIISSYTPYIAVCCGTFSLFYRNYDSLKKKIGFLAILLGLAGYFISLHDLGLTAIAFENKYGIVKDSSKRFTEKIHENDVMDERELEEGEYSFDDSWVEDVWHEVSSGGNLTNTSGKAWESGKVTYYILDSQGERVTNLHTYEFHGKVPNNQYVELSELDGKGLNIENQPCTVDIQSVFVNFGALKYEHVRTSDLVTQLKYDQQQSAGSKKWDSLYVLGTIKNNTPYDWKNIKLVVEVVDPKGKNISKKKYTDPGKDSRTIRIPELKAGEVYDVGEVYVGTIRNKKKLEWNVQIASYTGYHKK